MSEENTSQKERFLQEVEQKLLRRDLDARLLEDGLIHVRWNKQPLCSVDRDSIVRFRPADIIGPEVDRQLRTVTQTAGQVKEYMRIMGNRKLPFGYQMRMGEIVRNEPEANAVQDIFLQYSLGASLKEIAEQMSKTGLAYDEGKSWNKNMIARILENTKYTGADSYPRLVDIKLFEAAVEKRQTKQRLLERTPAQKALKRVCSKPPTPEIEQQVTHLLGRLAEQPERITQPEKQLPPIHSSTQAELDDVLNTQPLDEDAARSLICKLAQEQYDAIGNEEYETERLRRLFTAFECTAELNAELLQSAVSAVLVTCQTVRLQLKNGQIIGKDDLV